MDRRLREQLDACRPGHQDWESEDFALFASELHKDPALRALAAQLEALDEAIVASIHDVSPPPGLADRILARLEEQHRLTVEATRQTSSAADSEGSFTENAPAETAQATIVEAPSTASNRGMPRRRWLVVAASAAAVVMAAWLMWPGGRELYRVAQIVPEVEQAYREQLQNEQGWQAGLPSQATPLPREVRARPVAWRPVRLLGANGIAYDVQAQGGRRAVLLAIPCKSAGLPTSPPYQPQSSSGRSIAAWQPHGGDVLYVLVVEGSSRDYHGFVELGQNLT